MRLTLTILLLSLCTKIFATDYFVTATGNNTTGTSEATAWTSIATLNAKSSSLLPGDRVLFKRGETFKGSITLNKSGILGKPIIIGSFGTDPNKPIVSALTALTSWTSVGGGIYETTVATSGTRLNTVVFNDTLQQMGRFPNAGYFTVNTHSGYTLTSSQLTGSPNWSNAELVTRTVRWKIDRWKITAQSGSTITYTNDYVQNGYGFIIQNDKRTLDQLGEWYYGSGKLSMYFGAASPASYKIEISTINNNISSANQSYITFQDLALKGANEYGAIMSGGKGVQFKNCDIFNAGIDGIKFVGHPDGVVDGCKVTNAFNNGIAFIYGTSTNGIVRNSTITNTYFKAGMGLQGEGQGTGILLSIGGLAEYNKVINSGYLPIRFDGNNCVVRNNYINTFCFIKDDGAGVYTWGPKPYTVQSGRKILNNVILNGIGAPAGTNQTNSAAEGIYIDDNGNGIEITGNTISKTRRGIFSHNGQNLIISGNTLYDNNEQLYLKEDNLGDIIRTNNVNNNILFSKQSGQRVLSVLSDANDITQFGSFSSNYYCRPINEPVNNTTSAGGTIVSQWTVKVTRKDAKGVSYQADSIITKYFSLDRWKAFYPAYDVNSKTTAKTITNTNDLRFEFNETNAAKNVSLGGLTYIDPTGISYKNNNLALAPFSGKVLIVTPNVPLDPGTNTPPVVSITAPANNAVYTQPINLSLLSNATDADGVAKVEFYAGTTLLGTGAPPVNGVVWNSVPVGTWTITAKATDTKGLSTTSSPVSITVNPASTAPTVAITSPASKSSFIAPATVSITADVKNTVAITKVDFYNNTTLIGTVTTPPYTYTWSNVPVGSYSVTARATDANNLAGVSSPVTFSVRGLVAPSVNITSPENNQAFVTPATIAINATATDVDGTISKVEFYSNNVLINTDVTAPYAYTISGLAKGTYTLTAKAYDNDGQVTTSPGVIVTSAPNKIPPTISVTSPPNGSTYTDPALFNMSANASDADGQIVRVEFYGNGVFIGEDITSPYNITYSSVMAGTYNIAARAIDNDSIATVSAPITVTVTHVNKAPTIGIISPSEGDSSIVGEGFTMTSVATDEDGTISKVEYFDGTTLLGTSTAAPYSVDAVLPIGTYTITAKATDNSGATATQTFIHKVVAADPDAPIRVRGFKGVIK